MTIGPEYSNKSLAIYGGAFTFGNPPNSLHIFGLFVILQLIFHGQQKIYLRKFMLSFRGVSTTRNLMKEERL